jgi:hypothetical protein
MRAGAVDNHPSDRVIALRATDLTSEYRIDHRFFSSVQKIVGNRFDEELLNSENGVPNPTAFNKLRSQ